MLVDDSTVFLRAATFFLAQHREVEVVGTLCRGDQAVAQARLLKPQIVLLDLSLPGLPGLQVIAQLRDAMPEIKVIVLTLLDIEAFRQGVLAAGAAAFVSKVNARTDLLSAIRAVAQTNRKEVQAVTSRQGDSPLEHKRSALGEDRAYG